ncbi:pilus assembly protein PilX [Pantoea ananatis]|uniref:type 4 pilus major pilin n=1 Tax=Pantoea ananas TaxID=553 RepID=UPI000CF48462|nr:type 4 pilus major pilin [Pantoea ananatis]MDC7864998.1 pilus assembly protein PilX [Pantoea ananatis]PQK76516.1 pilus assembly protein PilX [Pantoea ananatis]
MSVSNNTVKVHPDRGWGFSEQGYIVLGTLLVIAIVVVAGWKLMHRKDTAVEVTSLQTMLSNGVALKGRNGYDYSSGASMTGILIQRDGAPSGYTVHGTPSSGTATLTNSYGGQVVIAPVAVNGYNNAFSVTTQSLPQSACIDVATSMNSSGTSNTLTINSTDLSNGAASSEAIAQACTADSGRTGNNTIVVTHNG